MISIMLSEEDYVKARAGNSREDYRPEIALAAKHPADEVERAVFDLADQRGMQSLTPHQLLALTREFMLTRYEAALLERAVN